LVAFFFVCRRGAVCLGRSCAHATTRRCDLFPNSCVPTAASRPRWHPPCSGKGDRSRLLGRRHDKRPLRTHLLPGPFAPFRFPRIGAFFLTCSRENGLNAGPQAGGGRPATCARLFLRPGSLAPPRCGLSCPSRRRPAPWAGQGCLTPFPGAPPRSAKPQFGVSARLRRGPWRGRTVRRLALSCTGRGWWPISAIRNRVSTQFPALPCRNRSKLATLPPAIPPPDRGAV